MQIPVELDEPGGATAAIVILDNAAALQPPSAKEATAKPTVFRTATVTRGNIAATIGATGTIEPEEVLDVGTQVAGQIIRFGDDPRGASDPSFKGKTIDFNSPVHKDMILAMIDPTPYKARVEQETAALQRAKAELALAEAKAKQEPAAIGNGVRGSGPSNPAAKPVRPGSGPNEPRLHHHSLARRGRRHRPPGKRRPDGWNRSESP